MPLDDPTPTPDPPDREPAAGRIPVSVLDLATVADGATSATALAETTEMARRAEALGYLRFWVAEHHNIATVASTVPSVLIAHLAAHTSTIAVGSGGVMLPNHATLSVAEQFAMLEALHPGRIDLGLGRAPGTDRATAEALRRGGLDADEEFGRHLLDLMGLLGDPRTEDGLWRHFVATPVATTSPRILLLGSSGFSAQLAGLLGLPFAFAHHFDMGGTVQAVGLYRDAFRPSDLLDEPYTIVTASTLAATDAGTADRLAAPARLRRYGIRTGRILPLLSPEESLAHPDYRMAAAAGTAALIGTGPEVVAGLDDLAARTGAAELMINTPTHGLAERLDSLERVAAAWGLAPR